jgi:hypothetical protein
MNGVLVYVAAGDYVYVTEGQVWRVNGRRGEWSLYRWAPPKDAPYVYPANYDDWIQLPQGYHSRSAALRHADRATRTAGLKSVGA